MSDYVAPTTLNEAVEFLSNGQCTVLAGGTDVYPALSGRTLSEPVIDITGIHELRGINRQNNVWRMGALTTWTDVIRARLPSAFDGLKQAARQVGSIQVQNVATVAGNLCNASPAADGVPPLLTLDASVELTSKTGVRSLPLSDFILGNRRTAKHPDEMLSAILIPSDCDDAISQFEKLGTRDYLVISIVSVSVLLLTENHHVKTARVAVGSCSEVSKRLTNLEAILTGCSLESNLGDSVLKEHLEPLSPIDDIRAGAAYRLDATEEMLRRTLSKCSGKAQ